MNSTLPILHRHPHERLAAIVLAAGASSRMGRLKPLLQLAGVPALVRTIALFRNCRIDEVHVVLGNRADELCPVVQRCGARCVVNAQWEEGMYSSVVAGARALPGGVTGAFVLPADVPLVREATIRQLAAAFSVRPESVIYPVFGGRHGHPPLIARPILNEAANGAPGPLSTLLAAHEPSACEVPVADEAIHLDMDTPADFDVLQALAARRDVPTTSECEAMLTHHHVPEQVVRHSRKVAEVARQIAEALVASGLMIDLELVYAGALLHDLAKGLPKHAEAAAAILRAYQMTAVASVVAAHTEMEFAGTIDERALVHLADKLVSGDRLVTLDQRFRPALDRCRDLPDALEGALRRKAVAERIACAIEARLGSPFAAILDSDAALPGHGLKMSRAMESRI